MGDLPDDTLLAACRIAVFPGGLYAAPAYLTEHGDPASPDDLAQHDALRLLGRNGEAVGWALLSGKQQWEDDPPVRIAANSPELLISLARAGAGVVAVPDYFAAPSVRGGELRRVLPDWHSPAHTAWVVFLGHRLMPTKTRAFIEMLVAALDVAH